MPRGSLKIQKFHSLGQQKVSQIYRTKKFCCSCDCPPHITNKVLVDKLHKSLKARHQNPRGQFNSQSQEDLRDQLRRVSLRSKQSHSSLDSGICKRGGGAGDNSVAVFIKRKDHLHSAIISSVVLHTWLIKGNGHQLVSSISR